MQVPGRSVGAGDVVGHVLGNAVVEVGIPFWIRELDSFLMESQDISSSWTVVEVVIKGTECAVESICDIRLISLGLEMGT